MSTERPHRLNGPRSRWPVQEFIAKALAITAGVIVLVSALAASLVILVVGVALVGVFGAYFWWKTRAVRKELRARAEATSIIEGEVVRSSKDSIEDRRRF